MKHHIVRIIMALIGLSLMFAACEAPEGGMIVYPLYGIFYMCSYPSIGRYYQLISLWSSIPGVSCAGWVMLTIFLLVLSVVVIPLSLIWHTLGALICLMKKIFR